MFINDINPVLFSIENVSIRYYGIIYALGFIITYYFLRYYIKKGVLKLKYEDLDTFILYLILGIVLGARIFEVLIYNLEYYLNHLNEIFYIWNGGLSFHGGLIGAIIVTWYFTKKHKIHFYDIADLMVIPASIALMLGRIANYTNSELYGTITNQANTPWCVVFKKVDDYCRHPTQLYESIKNLFMFIVLFSYERYNEKTSRKNYRKGTLFWLFALMYGILRFFITFLREEPTKFFGIETGLNMGQWWCLVMIIVASIFLWYINKKKVSQTRTN